MWWWWGGSVPGCYFLQFSKDSPGVSQWPVEAVHVQSPSAIQDRQLGQSKQEPVKVYIFAFMYTGHLYNRCTLLPENLGTGPRLSNVSKGRTIEFPLHIVGLLQKLSPILIVWIFVTNDIVSDISHDPWSRTDYWKCIVNCLCRDTNQTNLVVFCLHFSLYFLLSF